jgi:gamma-glutamylputrescine oxidase
VGRALSGGTVCDTILGLMPKRASRRQFLRNAAYAGGGALIAAGGLNWISPLIWRKPLALEPNRSYWARSQQPRNPKLSQDLVVDVAIVGGGLTGLSSAYFIRTVSPQKSVVVLEAEGCGNGASGRNGAMVLTMTADRFMNFSSRPESDKNLYELTANNVRSLAMLSAAIGIDCELQINGALQVFATEGEAKAAKDYISQARALGMPVEFWDASQTAAAIGTEAYCGGYFDPNCGHVHPMKLVHVFKAAAENIGAKIYESTVVQRIEPGVEHLLYSGDGYTIRAKSLVLASNAYTPNLRFLSNSILPLREYVAITRALSEEELEAVGWHSRVPFNDSRTLVYYFGLTADRRIHIGGGGPRYDFNNTGVSGTVRDVRSHELQLQRELVRVFPKLEGIGFEDIWSGVIDWSLDASASVGRIGRHRNIFYGLGYSGHGVNLTSVFGRIIADLDAGREEPWREFPFVNASLDYVPNEPFRWLAAETGLGWYNLTDSSGARGAMR